MYVRLVVYQKDENSGREMGLFMAMGELRENAILYEWEVALQEELYGWFKRNLKVPTVLSSTSNHYNRPAAISWFKGSATDHIDKMRQYAQILEAHDVRVVQLTTERPGKVVYEDEHQIAAVPYKDTFSGGR